MIWDQLHIEGPRDPTKLAAAFASALGIDPERVRVVASVEDVRFAGTTMVVLEADEAGGDFPNRVTIHLADRVVPSIDREGLAAHVARALRRRVLRDDGTPNPYTVQLFHPNGRKEPAALDVDALDRDDAVVLAAPKPAPPAPATATKPPPDKRAELERLMTYYVECPLPLMPATPAQDAALHALYAAVSTTGTHPSATQRKELERAVRMTRAAWPKGQIPALSTVDTLLKAAKLILS